MQDTAATAAIHGCRASSSASCRRSCAEARRGLIGTGQVGHHEAQVEPRKILQQAMVRRGPQPIGSRRNRAAVVVAARLQRLHGLPVSTTHVSVGALLGIGITTRQAKWKTVIPVLLAWVVTLPSAALLSALIFKGGQLFFL
jgi:hypothetical protein